jgi:2',3'-cyclic-nucleotide 2'-phosphodiesterase (5'-nucleotidase family)
MEEQEFAMLVDGGNFSGQRSNRDIEKGNAMLSGMELMGYDVVNIGDRELYNGLGNFRKMRE